MRVTPVVHGDLSSGIGIALALQSEYQKLYVERPNAQGKFKTSGISRSHGSAIRGSIFLPDS